MGMGIIKLNGNTYGGFIDKASGISYDNTNINAELDKYGIGQSDVSNVQDAIDGAVSALLDWISMVYKIASKFKVKDIEVTNVALTTQSDKGSYYGTIITYEDLGIPYGNIISITPLNWNGSTASFTPYLHWEQGVNAMTDSSQTISKISFRIYYYENTV